MLVTFSHETEAVEVFGGDGEEPQRPSDCLIEHSASADAHCLSLTIRLGDNVALENLALPAIRGHAAP